MLIMKLLALMAIALASSLISKRSHFYSKFELRSPRSNSEFYLEEYPSVKKAGVNPYANYEAFGTDGDRYPNLVFKSFGESDGTLVASADLTSSQFSDLQDLAGAVALDDGAGLEEPIIWLIGGGLAILGTLSIKTFEAGEDFRQLLEQTAVGGFVYQLPRIQIEDNLEGTSDTGSIPDEIMIGTEPFDLGELTEIEPGSIPDGNDFIEDILDGQFEFPDAEEGGSYFLASSPISGLSDNEYSALRGTGLSESEISEQFELLGDIYVFRGTSEGFPGNSTLQRLGISPASVDPFVATVFAVESNTKGGNGVVLYGSQEGFGNPAVELGNVRSTLEREVSVGLTPTEFAEAAPNSISVDQAREILQEIGFDIPSSLDSNAARDLLENTSKLSPQQVQEFVNKAASLQ